MSQNTAKHVKADRRRDRIAAEVPVRINGLLAGTTRDMSPSGVFFVTHRKLAVDQPVHFTLDLETPTGPLCLSCVGVVVRVEDSPGKRGIAVAIQSSQLERKRKA